MRRWTWIALSVVVAIPLMTAGWLVLRYRPRGVRESPAAVEREIIQRTAERDSLRAMIFAAAERSELLARRPEGDVLIGLPTPFVNALVQDIVTGWFHEVEL